MTYKYAGTTVNRHNEKTQCRETEQSHQSNQSPPATQKAANGAARGPLSASSACTFTQRSHGGKAAPRRPKGPLSASSAYTPSAKSVAATDGGHCLPAVPTPPRQSRLLGSRWSACRGGCGCSKVGTKRRGHDTNVAAGHKTQCVQKSCDRWAQRPESAKGASQRDNAWMGVEDIQPRMKLARRSE